MKVEWGVRGGMNGWGFTAGTRSEFNKTTMTYTWEGQALAAHGEFKFAYGAGWKIELNALADATDANDERYIKANTNLGANCLPGGENIKLADAGTYTYFVSVVFCPNGYTVHFCHILVYTDGAILGFITCC